MTSETKEYIGLGFLCVVFALVAAFAWEVVLWRMEEMVTRAINQSEICRRAK